MRPEVGVDAAAESALAALRAEVERDLMPVRPLRPERRLFPAVVFLVLAYLVSLGLWQGLRTDADVLGAFWLWGLSALELSLALVLLYLDLRGVVPGRRASATALALTALAGGLFHLLAYAMTSRQSFVTVEAGREVLVGVLCFCMELVLALPVAVAAFLLLRRGVVDEPGRMGILGGLAAGLAADAVWRTICPYSELAHVLAAHSGSVLVMVLIGLGVAVLWDRRRLREWRQRFP